jgi:hypothetical protein
MHIQVNKREMIGQVLVAHTCNPSYSGDRDQEDHGLKPDQANSLQASISKHPSPKKKKKKKRAGGMAQGENPEFKTHYCKKQNKKEL